MARVWAGMDKAGYTQLAFFCLPRFGLDLLIYGLLWTACGVISMQMAAQRDAMRALELRQELSAAHLRALQIQLEPHFLFNTQTRSPAWWIWDGMKRLPRRWAI
jgi:hypothetical protein